MLIPIRMIYRVTLKRTGGQHYVRREAGPRDLAEGLADSGGEAVEKLRKELRYHRAWRRG